MLEEEEQEKEKEEGYTPHSSGSAPLPSDRPDQVGYRQREMKNKNPINKPEGWLEEKKKEKSRGKMWVKRKSGEIKDVVVELKD